jgi:fructokinase
MGLFGGIEAGGTKFVCAVGTGPDDVLTQEFPTTTPEETMTRVAAFFANQSSRERIDVIGVGSFGPIDLNTGCITSTPKLAWRQFDLVGAIRRATGAVVHFDTDVNAAALAEHRWGAARGLDTFLYLTIGTGIGGGGMVNGRLMHGLLHPEMGHIRVPHDLTVDPFGGNCPSHADCLEGLAAGPALEARWGTRGLDLPPNHQGWELEAHYLALGLVNWICTLSPQRIIMGGGVMRRRELFPAIRSKVQELLNGYINAREITDAIDRYIVPPELGDRAGVLGAIALAQTATS